MRQQPRQRSQPPVGGTPRNFFEQPPRQQEMPYGPPGQRQKMPYAPPGQQNQQNIPYAPPRQQQRNQDLPYRPPPSRSSDYSNSPKARMAAEMAKYQQTPNMSIDNQNSNTNAPPPPSPWGPPADNQDIYGPPPGRDYDWEPEPLPTDYEESSPGYWSKYMSVSDGPDPMEPLKN